MTLLRAGAVALLAVTAQAQEKRKPVVPGALKPTLVVTEPEAEGLPEGAQRALTQAASGWASEVEGARYEVTSYAALGMIQLCADAAAPDCVQLLAKTLEVRTLVRIEAVAGKNQITIIVTAYDGASGAETKRVTRASAPGAVGDAVRAALEEATGRKAAPKTGARTIEAQAVAEPELAPLAGEAAAPAATAARRSPLRLDAAFGVGRAAESGAPEGATVALADVGLAFTLVDHLLLALELGQQVYDRRYQTQLPDADGTGALGLDVHERLLQARLAAGYNLLRFVVPDARTASAAPFAEIRAVRYENNVAPQTLLGGGAGLRAGVRVSDSLTLEGEFVYSFNLLPFLSPAIRKEVADLLAVGNMIGSMRYAAGVALELSPKLKASLAYRGEWLGEDRASRFTDGLALGLSVDL